MGNDLSNKNKSDISTEEENNNFVFNTLFIVLLILNIIVVFGIYDYRELLFDIISKLITNSGTEFLILVLPIMFVTHILSFILTPLFLAAILSSFFGKNVKKTAVKKD